MDSSIRDGSGYAELSCKTNFSFLRGGSHAEELIRTASDLKLTALAITDWNGVYAIPKAHGAVRERPALKLIVGAELGFEDQQAAEELISGGSVSSKGKESVIILAVNRQGYGALCRLLTDAHRDRPKGKAAVSFESFLNYHADWILLPRLLDRDRWGELCSTFRERVYLPLARRMDGFDRDRTETARQWSREFSVPIVAVNDVLYHHPSRRVLTDVLTCIREGVTLPTAGYKLGANGEAYLKSAGEMKRLFNDMPAAIQATVEIAGRAVFSPAELKYRYPSEWIPAAHSAQSYLEELTWAGAKRRYPGGVPDAVGAQLKHELALIQRLAFADYFLTIYDIVEFARSRKILCQGRGSAANSAVCYCLGVTAIDPVRMNLLFERFISVERGEPPDIDVDFEHERREEVIQYIYEKYGRDRAAMVSAVVTYQSRSAFREVCKAFSVPVGTLSAKRVEREFDALSANTTIPNLKTQVRSITDALKLFPRHLSIHSGGFTLSADPIIEIVPVEPATMPGRTIIQWDKYDLDTLGLLKVDILSLGMLTAIRKTLASVGRELHEIPAEDSATYRMIQRADTVGTFQIESRAQMNMLGRLLPKNFYDLVVEVAIVRPGPIIGKMVHPFLKRRRGEPVHYPDPRVEKILGKTLGIPLFQEQVMKLAIELAGFTPGEADRLRKAINGWRSNGTMSDIALRLMKGLTESGLPPKFAQEIFDQIQGFSMYGFPESHAASFALLAYASAYLKCHHPAEFTAALINSQPMGFYPIHTLIDDAKRHGVTVLPVHPERSVWDCTMEAKALRLGFRVTHGLSRHCVEHLIAERNRKPFSSLVDFFSRSSFRVDVLHRLSMAEAFECFGFKPREALWKLLEWERARGVLRSNRQLNLFRLSDTERVSAGFSNEITPYDQVRHHYAAFSLCTHAHPMKALRTMVTLPRMTTQEARLKRTHERVTLAGLILVRQRPPTAHGTTFSVLEDEFGFLDILMHQPVYEKYRDLFLNDCFLIVSGEIQRDMNSMTLVTRRLEPVWKSPPSEALIIEPTQYF